MFALFHNICETETIVFQKERLWLSQSHVGIKKWRRTSASRNGIIGTGFIFPLKQPQNIQNIWNDGFQDIGHQEKIVISERWKAKDVTTKIAWDYGFDKTTSNVMQVGEPRQSTEFQEEKQRDKAESREIKTTSARRPEPGRRELAHRDSSKDLQKVSKKSWSVPMCEETKAGGRPSNRLEGIIPDVVFQSE